MKELFLNVINNGDYSLRDMLKKINLSYIKSELTDDEKNELEEMARNNAKAINDYAPMEERLEEAFRRIEALEKEVVSIGQQVVSNKGTETDEPVEEPSEDEVVVEDEYKPFVKPLGGHDAYKEGDKITFNGKKYICLRTGTVYSPIEFPADWEEVVE